MADRKPATELVHRMPGRARLRVRLEDDEQELFERIAHEIARLPAVEVVRATASTGSLLIVHHGELEPILAQARQWLDLLPERLHAPMRSLKQAFERANASIVDRATPSEATGLSSLAFVALLGACAYQAINGKFLPAGVPLLGYALSLMNWAAEREEKA
jgi:hypothetical protein